MGLTEQLTALGTTILIGAIGYVVAWLRNKIANGKIAKQSPLLDVINNFLGKDYLLPYFKNTYETFVKVVEHWTDTEHKEAMERTITSVINTLPKYILNALKTVYPDYQLALRERLQVFYEKYKATINTYGERPDTKIPEIAPTTETPTPQPAETEAVADGNIH